MWQRVKNIYHLFQALIANIFYGFPSKKIKVIGVTGTDGKTTTTSLIYHILKTNGIPTSMISSVAAKIGKNEYPLGFHVTTPSPFQIQKFLKMAVKNKDQYFILETTSHALDQNRVWGINYYVGLITNITPEHLDYHKTFENYVATKTKLLNQSKIKIANKKSSSYQLIKQFLKDKQSVIDYMQNLKKFESFPGLASFNKENFAAAYTVSQVLGLTEEKILKAAKTFKMPKGRLDIIYQKKFTVIIDFAHTSNAFAVLLPEIKKKFIKDEGRLIHLFGAAGLRDAKKRPLMGKISSEFADIIILTEEDYRTENLISICEQIASGINRDKFTYQTLKSLKNKKNHFFTIIPNREKAIAQAIKIAKENDVVLLTGKGHEQSLARGKKEFPWDEKNVVIKMLKKFHYL
jgi:UDP-N-acetylmuramoyl-L-alanyl-D-glutamate--2,6-diaminopimelate ligase